MHRVQVGRYSTHGRRGVALLPGQEGGHLQVIYHVLLLVERLRCAPLGPIRSREISLLSGNLPHYAIGYKTVL